MKQIRRSITAAELMKQLEADPDFVARRIERDRVIEERIAFLKDEQSEIVVELRNLGINVDSLNGLVMRSEPYKAALPILLKHLNRNYSAITRATLARALAVPDATDAWPFVRDLYLKIPADGGTPDDYQLKEALAVALAGAASESHIDDLVALMRDASQGNSRLMLLRRLLKSKKIELESILDELQNDPLFSYEIASWRKKRKRRSKR